MPALKITIQGRVQQVGFRNFTLILARSMDITGEVWNRSDGAVDCVAVNPIREVLDLFAQRIEEGPGHIRDVQIESISERDHPDFSVGLTR